MNSDADVRLATAARGTEPGYVIADLGGWISGPCSHIGHLEVVPCQLKAGHLHLRDERHPDDVLHVRADEFAAFALMIKGGVYDYLFS